MLLLLYIEIQTCVIYWPFHPLTLLNLLIIFSVSSTMIVDWSVPLSSYVFALKVSLACLFAVLEVELWTSHMLGKHSTVELYPWPCFCFLYFKVHTNSEHYVVSSNWRFCNYVFFSPLVIYFALTSVLSEVTKLFWFALIHVYIVQLLKLFSTKQQSFKMCFLNRILVNFIQCGSFYIFIEMFNVFTFNLIFEMFSLILPSWSLFFVCSISSFVAFSPLSCLHLEAKYFYSIVLLS